MKSDGQLRDIKSSPHQRDMRGQDVETLRVQCSWQQMQALIDAFPSRIAFDTDARKQGLVLARVADAGPETNRQVATEIRLFLSQWFEEEENDREEDYVTAIEQELGDFFVIRNAERQIVALMNAQFAPLNERAESGGELIIWYVVTDKAYRGKGLATELYRTAYETALAQARDQQREIVAIVGETEATAERFFNSMGRKRLYYEDEEGVMHELPYVVPPSQADEQEVVEHFMVRFLDDRIVASVAEVTRLLEGIFAQYQHPAYMHDFSSERKEQQLQLITRTFDRMCEAIASAQEGTLYLYSAQERTQKMAEGKIFI